MDSPRLMMFSQWTRTLSYGMKFTQTETNQFQEITTELQPMEITSTSTGDTTATNGSTTSLSSTHQKIIGTKLSCQAISLPPEHVTP